MKKKTLSEAFGGTLSAEDDTDLEEDSEDYESDDGDEALAADLDIALDPESDPETRREAFRRAVKACK